MSAQHSMEMLFGKLPEFFNDEAELRSLWSAPDTRAKLMPDLANQGFGGDQLAEMQRIIDPEKSNLFDVLADVAYARPALSREDRTTRPNLAIGTRFTSRHFSDSSRGNMSRSGFRNTTGTSCHRCSNSNTRRCRRGDRSRQAGTGR